MIALDKIQELSHSLREYQTRPVRFLELLEIENWQIKLYGISSKSDQFKPGLIDLSKRVFNKRIHDFPDNLTHYECGFGIIHEGNDGNYIVFCTWIEENMIDLIIYYSNPDNPLDFQPISPSSIVTCVWELEILYFEKKAWVDHILKKPGKIAFEKYLKSTFNIDV